MLFPSCQMLPGPPVPAGLGSHRGAGSCHGATRAGGTTQSIARILMLSLGLEQGSGCHGEVKALKGSFLSLESSETFSPGGLSSLFVRL